MDIQRITIVGGCGHVGLPLGLAFAHRGLNVTLYDINEKAVEMVNAGDLPFEEEGAQELLREYVGKNLRATTNHSIRDDDAVIFVTGTPVDEHLNPKVNEVVKVINTVVDSLREDQLIVLRSTVYPGTTKVIYDMLRKRFPAPSIAYCPERMAQGKGVKEIFNLPQITSAMSCDALKKANDLFSVIAPKILELSTEEAELAKLMTNSWRYLEFSIANQFYMIAEQKGLNFTKIFQTMTDSYPRAKNFAKPGFAAGPCLFKDTMQLVTYHNNNFFLGHAAMLVNEGLPNFIVERLEKIVGGDLTYKKIAVLGMTFKANNDDTRESLAFKVKKCLEMKSAEVIVNDPYLDWTTPLDTALEEAEAIVLATPHDEYLNLRPKQPYVDCWGVWPINGVKGDSCE